MDQAKVGFTSGSVLAHSFPGLFLYLLLFASEEHSLNEPHAPESLSQALLRGNSSHTLPPYLTLCISSLWLFLIYILL